MAKKQRWDDEEFDFEQAYEPREKRKQRPDRTTSIRFAEAPSDSPEPAGRGEVAFFRPREQAPGPARPREFFPATCAQCGVQTTVPFKPTLGRAVRCRGCFQQAV